MTTQTAAKFAIENLEPRLDENFFEENGSRESLHRIFEPQHAAELRSRFFRAFVFTFEMIGRGIAWLAGASISRKIGPGARSLERHEFESVEIRRGGFGNVF